VAGAEEPRPEDALDGPARIALGEEQAVAVAVRGVPPGASSVIVIVVVVIVNVRGEGDNQQSECGDRAP
jgi:hypothetical protein